MCTHDIDQKVFDFLRRKQLVKLNRLKQYMVCLSIYATFKYLTHFWCLLSEFIMYVIMIDKVKKTCIIQPLHHHLKTTSSKRGGGGTKVYARNCTLLLCSICLFLSLHRLFWNQTRITRGERPVISTICSFMSASGLGLAV